MVDNKKPVTGEDVLYRLRGNTTGVDSKLTKQVMTNTEDILKTNQSLVEYIDVVTKDLEDIHNQLDGNVTSWFFPGVPTLGNEPAINWTTDSMKNDHLGDLYYDQDTGAAYRFEYADNTYKWELITDELASQALAAANAAQDTADSKRRTFVVQPIPPYDVGDIWIQNDTDLYRCKAARASGSYSSVDWIRATDYSNDDYAKGVESVLNAYKEEVTTTYSTKAELVTTKESIEGSVSSLTTVVDGVNTRTNENSSAIEILDTEISLTNQRIVDVSKELEGYQKITIPDSADTYLYSLKITGNDSATFPSNFNNLPMELKSPKLYVNYGTENEKIYDLKIPSLKKLPIINTTWEQIDALNETWATKDNKNLSWDSEYVQDYYQLVNGKATLFKFIQTDNDGNESLMTEPQAIDMGEVLIKLEGGKNEIWFPKFAYNLEILYLTSNIYTDAFSDKITVVNQIKASSEGVLLESKTYTDNAVDGDNLISKINLSSGNILIEASNHIKLEGYTTVGDKIKFHEDGTIEAVDGKFSGDVYLSDGGKVIGGDGLLTNLHFESNGSYNGFELLGFTPSGTGNLTIHKTDLFLNIFIPNDFIIEKVYVTLQHNASYWADGFWGYSRNLKLYTSQSNQNAQYYLAYLSGNTMYRTDNLIGREVVNAFGSDTYSPTNTSGNVINSKTTSDLKLIDPNILKTGDNMIFVRTMENTLQDWNYSQQRTGVAKIIVNVIGYTKMS